MNATHSRVCVSDALVAMQLVLSGSLERKIPLFCHVYASEKEQVALSYDDMLICIHSVLNMCLRLLDSNCSNLLTVAEVIVDDIFVYVRVSLPIQPSTNELIILIHRRGKM